ncbi:alpha/beta hydrolase [Sungkyunkwania multivorans]|uniref:Alpha/beta hydrolase n=1 Tax=Sungkyunkwania multivorans TaxID=1173618 RepID=A0ABW3CX61_9FLAO
MKESKLHVYLMPGMAANPSIFERISLPKDRYELHLLSWILPLKNESLRDYALRMCEKIVHPNAVLVGVSFGGVLVQEMSKHLDLKKLIIISSVKSKHELPKRMKIAKRTKAYKILPTSLIKNFDALAKYAFGETVVKRVELYKKYLSVRDKAYLDWAIHNMVNWDQDAPIEGIVHIHGEKDAVFPAGHLDGYIEVKGGTHVMVINKFKWFNENLPKIIEA